MPRRTTRRTSRVVVAGLGTALLLSGCGFSVQTLQEYTPAQGVNVDAGSVKVRNFLVIADEDGQGVVSASMVSPTADRLTGISLTPLVEGNVEGTPLTVSDTGDVELPANNLVVLSDAERQVQVSGEDLTPGLSVRFVVTFASGAQAGGLAPVMGYNQAQYATLSPTPQPTASPTTSPAAPADTQTDPAATPTTTP